MSIVLTFSNRILQNAYHNSKYLCKKALFCAKA